MRLIDADKLMKAMYHRAFETDGDTMWQSGCWVRYRAIEQVVKEQPTVKTEPQWIPCSERLPHDKDYDETFIVTIQCEHVDGWDDYVTGYADWTPHGWDIQSYYMGQIKVTAWMPLPEPYMEVDE